MAEGPFSIEWGLGGEPVPCRADQTLLDALARRLVRLTSGCHGGGCGICKIAVQSGTFVAGRVSRAHVSQEEEIACVSLACQVYPRSDMRVRVLGGIRKCLARRCGLV